MGIFTRDYSKPGRGVDPNAPRKNAFFMFFELFGRKISRLISLNLIYFVVIMPLFIYGYMVFYQWVFTVNPIEGEIVAPPLLDIFGAILTYVPSFLFIPLLIVSAIA